MSTRKFESDYSKIQKKRIIDTLQKKKGAMNKKEQCLVYYDV